MLEPEDAALDGAAKMREAVERLRVLLVAAAVADTQAAVAPVPSGRPSAGVTGAGVSRSVGELLTGGGHDSILIASCQTNLILDLTRRRFRRLPHSADPDAPCPASHWRAYYRFEFDADTGTFTLGLNEDNTKLLRARVHLDPCRHCAQPAAARAAAGT